MPAAPVAERTVVVDDEAPTRPIVVEAPPIFVETTVTPVLARFAAAESESGRVEEGASRLAPALAAAAARAAVSFASSSFAAANRAFATFASASRFAAFASLSRRTTFSQRALTSAALCFTRAVSSSCVCALASVACAGGAYFCSLDTAFPHAVSFRIATDMGMRPRVRSIFRIKEDLNSVLA